MNITEIAFVGYTVTDLPRARAFYEGILGLKPESVFEEGGMAFIEYWMGKNGEHCIVIGKGADHMKPGAAGATAALEVEDFGAAEKKLRDGGVKFIMEPLDLPSCQMTLVEDPDGNRIMIHKRKSK
ncbi:MAG TPA: VOC family protein [Candidatus Paceibacterota bacterium]